METKPGWKTTEFWFTAASQLVGILWASGAIQEGSTMDRVLGIVAAALATTGYAVSRGLAKRQL